MYIGLAGAGDMMTSQLKDKFLVAELSFYA
jgi:hypothetical protein